MPETNQQRLARLISEELTRANGVPTEAVIVEGELQFCPAGTGRVTRLLVPHEAYATDNLALWEENGLPATFLVGLPKA